MPKAAATKKTQRSKHKATSSSAAAAVSGVAAVFDKSIAVEQRVLGSIVRLEHVCLPAQLRREIICRMVGYNHTKTKSYEKALKDMKQKNWIKSCPNDGFVITQDGRNALSPTLDVAPIETNAAIHEFIKTCFLDEKRPNMGKAKTIFDILVGTDGSGPWWDRQELLQKVGYSHPRTKGFEVPITALNQLVFLKQTPLQFDFQIKSFLLVVQEQIIRQKRQAIRID